MIITLSPAKIMSFEQQPDLKPTEPIFKKQRDEIIALLRELSVEEVRKLMNINQQQADVVLPQIHQFGKKGALSSASAFAYNGIAFKGLDFSTLSPDDMLYAQQHLLIGSAVYGFVRPLDKVHPYRLEMQAKLANPKGRTLYDYWQETLTNYLSKRISQEGKLWLNLSSDEYAKAIDPKGLPSKSRIVTPQFKEEDANGYRQVVVHTKKARGMMARFVIENRIETVEDLNAFNTEGYCYAGQLSTDNEPTFIR
ncbi:MAG: hypothetical protein BGN96_09550 [Bacteroidales bacterium 45-6]|nr:MAG: hypothetical protein BGN96_09550 [Bacteroidales bacterium 45-6]